MKNMLTLLCLSVTALASGHAYGQAPVLPAQFGPHQWTATVKVIGEDGNPVAGADVSAEYDVARPAGSDQPSFGDVKGLTDSNGIFVASHTDSSWNLGIIAEKAGYYRTHIGYQFYFDDKRRHPSFTLILKKIGRPIPMYAKRLNTHVPALDKPVGFDLMAGDWVAPYGKGVNSDILFTGHFNKGANGESDFTLAVGFPNPGDGIQEFDAPALIQDAKMGQSDLRSSNEAPIDGYQSQWVQTDNRKPGQPVETNRNPNHNYYFRVRTVLDSQGNILSTHYGKIYGDFMQFTYYLNPTPNDRNIEFDPKQDLLGGLPFDAQVRLP
ncbi:MAG TPA: hypothetical protein VMF08_12570 [Candidatus Sulfotelmatobacter sp.]|nr:hypothetical protein [Candidatus Sulfotelmatobacter sp.]